MKPENVRVLGTCRAVVCGPRLRDKYGTSMVNAAESFLRAASIVRDDEIDDGDFIRLINAGIDGGEAQLFASKVPGITIITTDDKRAMVKLATTTTLSDIHLRHVQRVVCTEQIIVSVAEVRGYDYVDGKIRHIAWADDKVLQAWAGGKGQDGKEALKLMRSHIEELNTSTKGLLLRL